VLLAAAIERLYALNVGTTPVQEGAPHEKSHKPLLLMVESDLIDEGLATPDRIPWRLDIRDLFAARFLIVKKHNDQNNHDLPYRYLAGDGFWLPVESDGIALVTGPRFRNRPASSATGRCMLSILLKIVVPSSVIANFVPEMVPTRATSRATSLPPQP
jgi:hypothetical protein